MHPLTPAVNSLLSVLTIVGDAMILAFVLLLLVRLFKRDVGNKVLGAVARRSVLFSFVIVLIAVLGSLFFSDIAGYEPCILCWYQRIFMYPMLPLFGLSILRQEKRYILDYGLILSGIGALIAAYHYYIQVGGSAIIPCSAVGYSTACSDRFVLQYGYITIPMMALTAFLLIILLMFISKYFAGKKQAK